MLAIVLPSETINMIENSLVKMLVMNEEMDWVGRDFTLVSKEDGRSPGTVYIYKEFSMDRYLYNSLKTLHFDEREMKGKETWGSVFRYRPFIDPLIVKGQQEWNEYTVHDIDVNLPKASDDFIKDVKNYDPRVIDNARLSDDWRIVCGWYSTLREGGQLDHSQEDVENLALIIVRELLKRGIELGSETEKKWPKELLKITLKRIKQKGLYSDYLMQSSKDLTGLERIDLEMMKIETRPRDPTISFTGKIADQGWTDGNIDFHIESDHPEPTVEMSILKQLNKDIWKRVRFSYDEMNLGSLDYSVEINSNSAELEESDFMSYPLRYLGNKNRLLDTIFSSIPKDTDIMFDVFAGSGIVSYSAKRLGMKVVSNDVLYCSHSMLSSIIENSDYRISDDEVNRILAVEPNVKGYATMTYPKMYDEQTRMYIDSVIKYAEQKPDKERQFIHACLFTTMFRLSAMTRSFNIELINTRRSWNKGGPFLPNFKEILNEKAHELNKMISSGQGSKALNRNALELGDLTVNGRMVIYLDPPYISEHSKSSEYSSVYSKIDSILLQKEIKNPSPWSHKDFMQRLIGLFTKFKDAGALILSYKVSSDFTPKMIVDEMRKIKPYVLVKAIPFKYDIVRKDQLGKSDAQDKELLIIGMDSKRELRQFEKRVFDEMISDNSTDGSTPTINAEIVQKDGTKSYLAIRDDGGIPIPFCMIRTMPTYEIGSIVKLKVDKVNQYMTKSKHIWFNCSGVRPIELTGEQPTPIQDVEKMMIRTNGVVDWKEMPTSYKTFYDTLYMHGDHGASGSENLWQTYPDIPNPRFVLQAHIRGRSVHLDNRRQVDKNFGVGMTHPLSYSLSREPTSISDARKLFDIELKDKVMSELNDVDGKLMAIQKTTVPIEWLDVEGEVEPGQIGSTKNKSAYFIILDKGEIEFLTLKNDFHEYQYHGEKGLMIGKYIDRKIPDRDTWLFFKTDTIPYILSDKAISTNFITPKGESGLPKSMEKRVGKEYRYWLMSDDAERIRVRDAFRLKLGEKWKNFSSDEDQEMQMKGDIDNASAEFSMMEYKVSTTADFSTTPPSNDTPDVLYVEGPLFREGVFGNPKKGEDIYYPAEVLKNAKLEPRHRAMNLAYLNIFHEKYNELARVGLMTDVWWEPTYEWTDKRSGAKGKGALWCRAVCTDKDGIKMILSKKQYQLSAELKYQLEKDSKTANWVGVLGAAILDTPAVDTAQISVYKGRMSGKDQDWNIEGKLPIAM